MRTVTLTLTPEDEARIERVRAYMARAVSADVPGVEVTPDHVLLMALLELADQVNRAEARRSPESAQARSEALIPGELPGGRFGVVLDEEKREELREALTR